MSDGYFAIENPVYMPSMRLIDAITQTNPAIVTTSFDHGYVTGTVVRIDVPRDFGMPEIDKQTGTIIVTGDDTFAIDIDSTFYEPFAVPSPIPAHMATWAQVVPIGSDNATLLPAVQNIL